MLPKRNPPRAAAQPSQPPPDSDKAFINSLELLHVKIERGDGDIIEPCHTATEAAFRHRNSKHMFNIDDTRTVPTGNTWITKDGKMDQPVPPWSWWNEQWALAYSYGRLSWDEHVEELGDCLTNSVHREWATDSNLQAIATEMVAGCEEFVTLARSCFIINEAITIQQNPEYPGFFTSGDTYFAGSANGGYNTIADAWEQLYKRKFFVGFINWDRRDLAPHENGVRVEASAPGGVHWGAFLLDRSAAVLQYFDSAPTQERLHAVGNTMSLFLRNIGLDCTLECYALKQGVAPDSWSCGYVAAYMLYQSPRAQRGISLDPSLNLPFAQGLRPFHRGSDEEVYGVSRMAVWKEWRILSSSRCVAFIQAVCMNALGIDQITAKKSALLLAHRTHNFGGFLQKVATNDHSSMGWPTGTRFGAFERNGPGYHPDTPKPAIITQAEIMNDAGNPGYFRTGCPHDVGVTVDHKKEVIRRLSFWGKRGFGIKAKHLLTNMSYDNYPSALAGILGMIEADKDVGKALARRGVKFTAPSTPVVRISSKSTTTASSARSAQAESIESKANSGKTASPSASQSAAPSQRISSPRTSDQEVPKVSRKKTVQTPKPAQMSIRPSPKPTAQVDRSTVYPGFTTSPPQNSVTVTKRDGAIPWVVSSDSTEIYNIASSEAQRTQWRSKTFEVSNQSSSRELMQTRARDFLFKSGVLGPYDDAARLGVEVGSITRSMKFENKRGTDTSVVNGPAGLMERSCWDSARSHIVSELRRPTPNAPGARPRETAQERLDRRNRRRDGQ